MITVSPEQALALRQLYQQYEAEYETTLKRLNELAPVMTNLRGLIGAFDSEAAGASHREERTPQPPPPVGAMPMRKPQYRAMTVIEAAQQILDQKGTPMHADEIVRAIYEIRSPQGFTAAKRSVVSELIRGTKRGVFRRARGANRFASAREEDPQRRLTRELSANGGRA